MAPAAASPFLISGTLTPALPPPMAFGRGTPIFTALSALFTRAAASPWVRTREGAVGTAEGFLGRSGAIGVDALAGTSPRYPERLASHMSAPRCSLAFSAGSEADFAACCSLSLFFMAVFSRCAAMFGSARMVVTRALRAAPWLATAFSALATLAVASAAAPGCAAACILDTLRPALNKPPSRPAPAPAPAAPIRLGPATMRAASPSQPAVFSCCVCLSLSNLCTPYAPPPTRPVAPIILAAEVALRLTACRSSASLAAVAPPMPNPPTAVPTNPSNTAFLLPKSADMVAGRPTAAAPSAAFSATRLACFLLLYSFIPTPVAAPATAPPPASRASVLIRSLVAALASAFLPRMTRASPRPAPSAPPTALNLVPPA